MASVVDRLRELDQRLRSNWDVDWNSPRHILASDGSGKHQATAMTVPIAEDIVAMRNALPAVVTALETLNEVARSASCAMSARFRERLTRSVRQPDGCWGRDRDTMSERLYVTKSSGSWKWHIAAHPPSGYGVRVLCGPGFSEGAYRTRSSCAGPVCKSCDRIYSTVAVSPPEGTP